MADVREKLICNQMCGFNDPSDGCVKPDTAQCPLSSAEPDYTGAEQAMTDYTKKKLIKLLARVPEFLRNLDTSLFRLFRLVDYLIANGVTVLTADEQRNIYTVQEIEELQNEAYDLGADSVLHNRFGLSWNDAAELRKEVAKLQTAAKWIPVTERLPKGECIALGYQNEMLIGYIGDSEYSDTGYAAESDGEHLSDVTHWMPLPEPPKEETQ